MDCGVSELYAFQLRLAERMQAASDCDPPVYKLSVMIGERACLLDVREIVEVVTVQAITSVPFTHDWYLGLTNVRGSITSVIDYARLTGGNVQLHSHETRMIVSSVSAHALMVTRIYGMVDMRSLSWVRQPYTALPGAIALYEDEAGVSWLEVSLARLMDDEQVLQVAR
jgi:twitching motility protein PilI